jgi:two-component system response regulator
MEEKMILLVEDNADDEALTLRALKKNNLGNTVVVARDGAEALIFCFARAPTRTVTRATSQVILLDLKLPKVDGMRPAASARTRTLVRYPW